MVRSRCRGRRPPSRYRTSPIGGRGRTATCVSLLTAPLQTACCALGTQYPIGARETNKQTVRIHTAWLSQNCRISAWQAPIPPGAADWPPVWQHRDGHRTAVTV